jgi:hypothetical protein
MAEASERDRLIDEAVAREAIRDLVARYNSNSDSGRFAPLFELFAADAVMETGELGGELTRYEGLEEITKIFTGAQDRVQSRPDSASPGYIRHFTATHQIDLIDVDHASGRLYFAVLMAHGLDHWGRYIDQYVRRDARWKFAHRKVYVDGRTAGSWFAGPGPAQP